ncbi:MAG: CaiB/BaiF CoA-transferase family protein [Gammaproteobacteria bacterium]|nr:CaiB/BaiF CoA-transferase family protein [Gammaproteobacteria bacterium]
MAGSLDGVRVIDLTTVYSGPISASILGDQGADVIKVEALGGEMMRGGGRPERNGLNGSFAMMNRNKRSLALNLREQAGKDVLLRLVADADVVMENFRPGVMERLGIGYEQLREINERLVYASINGVGATGPYANRRVYDAVIQAISGAAALQQDPEQGEPVMVNTLLCDKLTSMTAAQTICSALYACERTGKGQKVEISMLDSALFFLWPDSMTNFMFVGDDVPQMPTYSHSFFVRKTKDGYICTMPVQKSEWEGLFASLELPDLLEDPRLVDGDGHLANIELFNELLNEGYATIATAELCSRLDENQVPFAEINSRAAVIDDPQIKAMGALMEFEHPVGGSMRQPRPPGRFSATPADIFRCSPELGADTDDVLREAGFSDAEVHALRDSGIVA